MDVERFNAGDIVTATFSDDVNRVLREMRAGDCVLINGPDSRHFVMVLREDFEKLGGRPIVKKGPSIWP